jgi:hypothetical protein
MNRERWCSLKLQCAKTPNYIVPTWDKITGSARINDLMVGQEKNLQNGRLIFPIAAIGRNQSGVSAPSGDGR